MRNAIRRLAEETIEERQGELDRIRKEFLRHGETVSKGPEFVARQLWHSQTIPWPFPKKRLHPPLTLSNSN